MKFLKIYWKKLVGIILIVTLSIYVLTFGLSRARDIDIFKPTQEATKIYEIWHIETFEGGGKSRINYLKSITNNIEKDHKNILFLYKSISPLDLKSNLEDSTPDIISFGYGVGDIVLPYLTTLDKTYTVRDELVSSGMYNRSLYALPYIVSGYCIVRHHANANEFHVGENEYTSPNIVYDKLNYSIETKESQYEAYKSFVNNKNSILLGTGRDLYRINNLNNIGRTNASIEPIDSYTDLIQYIGIINSDKVINRLLKCVFESKNQMKLVEYSLFSSLHNKIYQTGIYNDMENAIFNAKIPNVFRA